MAEKSVIATIIRVAGAGFRLSLILNAVGVEMVTANREIQTIAKEISLGSLMLKQVGLAMNTPGVAASRSALEMAKGIAMQNEAIFTEIKDMAEMSQQQDENGHIRSITIAGKAQSWFRKKRVQYLLGQLVSLKLSLSIMLQILQLGKIIAGTRRDTSKIPLKLQEMLQERAEIQNMVVVRLWSLVDLQGLYQLAEDEAAHPHDSPLPENREMQQIEGDPRLFITAAAHEENTSNAMVKYHETPLSQLEASWDKAMSQPNRLLQSADNNIVDRLLREWTRSPEMEPKAKHTSGHQAHVDSDTDDSDSEFERPDTRGYYLEARRKEVRFQPWVEDDEESDRAGPRKKGPKRGIIRSGSEDSSSSSSCSEDILASRRSSTSSTISRKTSNNDPSGGTRRQIPAGVYGAPGSTGIPPGVPPGIRTGPPSPRMSRPVSIPSQPRGQVASGQPSQQHHHRHHPPYPPVSGSPYRPPPSNVPGPGGPLYGGYSPHGRVNMFHQPPQQPQNGNPFPAPRNHPPRSEPRHHKPRSQRRERADSGKSSSFKENAKKDVKRGLLGAGAVAGLMDILEGLSAI